jgi:ElaA protein
VVDPGLKYAEPSIGRVITSPETRGGQRRISAQAHLERFYGGFGYARVAPDHIEDGIPHVLMLRSASPVPQEPAARTS